MNEFIVWDKVKKEFTNNWAIIKNSLCYSYSGHWYDANNYQVCNYISKKDVNNKKIYADCSIVKWEKQGIIYCGFFSFDKENLRYEINIWNQDEIVKVDYFYLNHNNFKIIDTIQENKLGLVNEKK